MGMDISSVLKDIRSRDKLSQQSLAQVLGVSFVSVNRWERGATVPSPAQTQRILELYKIDPGVEKGARASDASAFSSKGIRRSSLPLFEEKHEVILSRNPLRPIIERLVGNGYICTGERQSLAEILKDHQRPASTVEYPPLAGMSAGKNTYTYDAHTYHTKVPPQGITELLKHYLPDKQGLVLDPFAGSGMTGVAGRVNGYDSILNELSPAACFIANRFVSFIDPILFEAGVRAVLDELMDIRATLYTTTCRECSKEVELLYVVWSYNVLCNYCEQEFLLWDHCRRYGKRVRDHEILKEFPCPACNRLLKKRRLKRTIPEPVQVGYKCCGSRQKEATHPPNQRDLELILSLELSPPVAEEFYPTTDIPEGVNLRQPKRHGVDRIDRYYTPRNLAALSHLWKAIHRIDDLDLAAHLAFVFTSLYQRVTRLSEFRFWGGSGNTARFNVPFIFNEANVFITFARKARTIQDHLEATATYYRGKSVVVENSATTLGYLPNESVDLIFTDPPFGGNINYSEVNILWESWLGRFTKTKEEAIVNKIQGKSVTDYQRLMTASLKECYRVLRPGHWMLLVFMNSSREVWNALRSAISDAGFDIHKADIFDKQHGTFKQFVSENTAGYDLVLHCLKPISRQAIIMQPEPSGTMSLLFDFLNEIDFEKYTNEYLHVERDREIDFRKLYSEWVAIAITKNSEVYNFIKFRSIVEEWLKERPLRL